MPISSILVELWQVEFEKSSLKTPKTECQNTKFHFSTSSLHNSTNTGPLDMFFTKNWNYFSQETRWDGIIHFCLCFWHFNFTFWTKKMIFPNLIFQLHLIITPLILDWLACSVPKTNTTFHKLSEYDKNDTICSLITGVIN